MPKRNLDRIREIIIEVIETSSVHDDGFVDYAIKMKAGDTYQLYLMEGASLIEGKDCKEGFFFVTNEGQDFYDAIKSDSVWERTKEAVAETGGNATLDILRQLAIGYLKQTISKKTGISL